MRLLPDRKLTRGQKKLWQESEIKIIGYFLTNPHREIKIKELVEYTGLSRKTIWKHIREHCLPGFGIRRVKKGTYMAEPLFQKSKLEMAPIQLLLDEASEFKASLFVIGNTSISTITSYFINVKPIKAGDWVFKKKGDKPLCFSVLEAYLKSIELSGANIEDLPDKVLYSFVINTKAVKNWLKTQDGQRSLQKVRKDLAKT